jgi:two-component system nitrogen regulation response regulator NtrX
MRNANPVPLPLLGASDAARRGRDALDQASARRTPVLVAAEPGCRPGLIARVLHDRTSGAAVFIDVDCAAVESSEINAALFGAPAAQVTALDLEWLGGDAALLRAAGGTLFIENVDDLPSSAQRRLARILRDTEARVAGSSDPVSVTCRVISSTTKDLDVEVREGRFRQDLLRRISVSRITVPSLRQRSGDLEVLIERLVAESHAAPRTFTQPAVTVLSALPWTQNIDELSGVLAKVFESAGAIVRQEDVLAHVPIEGAFARFDLTASLREARRRFEREYIAAVLERHQWRMSDAARTLGIERANLYRKTRQLGITRIPRAEVS